MSVTREPRGADAATWQVRPMHAEDVDAVLDLEHACFPDVPPERRWQRAQLEGHVGRFPDGQFVAEKGGRVLGSCTNMLTTWERAITPHTWSGITGGGTLARHDPDGDVLYGTEVMVHPDARRQGVGRRLFNARFGFVRAHGLRAFVTGGRLPGYAAKAAEMKPQEYVDAVVRGDFPDPVLTPDLKWGLTPRGVLCGYLTDPNSLHHAALVVWENPEWGR